MRRPFVAVLLAVAALTATGATSAFAQGGGVELSLNTYTDSSSYYIGLQIIRNLKKEGIQLNMDIFFAGVEDAINHTEAKLNPSQRMNILLDLQSRGKEMASRGEDSSAKFAEKLYGKVTSNSPSKIKARNDSVSYTIGYNVGEEVNNQQSGINTYALISAMKALREGKPLLLTESDQLTLQMRLESEVEFMETVVKKNMADEERFLKENAKRSGVITLPSGLQYEVLTEGTGARPTIDNTVTVHYKGSLIDGSVFDSSFERNAPVTFELKKVIKGWVEALQMMPVGSKWKLYIPSKLAYGSKGIGDKISPYTTLIFEVELLAIEN